MTFVAHDPTDQTTPTGGEDPALSSLQQRLDAARKGEDARLARDHAPLRDESRAIGMQVASTMLGYPLGGIVIGWGLDQLFGTRPWIMIGLMFMAFAGAVLQVVRNNNNRPV